MYLLTELPQGISMNISVIKGVTNMDYCGEQSDHHQFLTMFPNNLMCGQSLKAVVFKLQDHCGNTYTVLPTVIS